MGRPPTRKPVVEYLIFFGRHPRQEHHTGFYESWFQGLGVVDAGNVSFAFASVGREVIRVILVHQTSAFRWKLNLDTGDFSGFGFFEEWV